MTIILRSLIREIKLVKIVILFFCVAIDKFDKIKILLK
jgi:hypothetical protein